jgi:hypothetical protein
MRPALPNLFDCEDELPYLGGHRLYVIVRLTRFLITIDLLKRVEVLLWWAALILSEYLCVAAYSFIRVFYSLTFHTHTYRVLERRVPRLC